MTKRIGIMLELMWPYRRHLDVFAGTQRFAREQPDWQCDIDEFHADQSSGRIPLKTYEGLIARAGTGLAKRAKRKKLPLVNVWYNSPARDRLPGVFPGFSQIGALAGEHLIERGFRQFACASGAREAGHKDMTEAFHRVIRQHGCHCACQTVGRFYYRNGKSWATFQKTLSEWMSTWKPPIALFVAFNDVTIRYIVNACRRQGWRVPEDVAIVGGMNEPNVAEMPPPSLTSVEINYEQIGYHAAKMLSQLMSGQQLAQQHIFLPPTGVVARDSTDYFAVDDEVVAAAMRFIEQSAKQDIDVNDVADAAGVSRRTLERRFREGCGRSVAKEIRRLRILKAKRLLIETDMQVKQIAREVGFSDSIRMYEAFMRDVNITPSDFRRQTRGERMP